MKHSTFAVHHFLQIIQVPQPHFIVYRVCASRKDIKSEADLEIEETTMFALVEDKQFVQTSDHPGADFEPVQGDGTPNPRYIVPIAFAETTGYEVAEECSNFLGVFKTREQALEALLPCE